MNNYVVFVFAFLLGSLVFAGIFISVTLYQILLLQRKQKEMLDVLTMKHDCIAEWLIEEDLNDE